MTVQIDEARVEQLTKEQVALLAERWPRSLAFAERAGRSLAGGVSCAWHALTLTLYGERGEARRSGTSTGTIRRSPQRLRRHDRRPRAPEGDRGRGRARGAGHALRLPTEDSVIAAEHLQQRFGLPLWRFKTTGSEATMDAVRIMRAATGGPGDQGRGAYHGSADGLAFSY
jgi:glutamate-1-semialdehyde 2,1-aminomutase